MKIASWNCGGAFRKKFDRVFRLKADIYIIQECEDIRKDNQIPDFLRDENLDSFIWTGDNKNKGLRNTGFPMSKTGINKDLMQNVSKKAGIFKGLLKPLETNAGRHPYHLRFLIERSEIRNLCPYGLIKLRQKPFVI